MFRSSRVTTFRFDGKTQLQMFLLLYGRYVGAPRQGTNIDFGLFPSLRIETKLKQIFRKKNNHATHE